MATRNDFAWRRLTGALGLLFLITFAIGLIGFVFPVYPDPDEPIEEIRTFLADEQTAIHTANWILVSSVVFFYLPFAAGLSIVLGDGDVDGGLWSRIAFGAAVATVAVAAAGSAFSGGVALAYDSEGFSESVLRMMLYADAVTYAFAVPLLMALFLGATAISILRSHAVSPWFGWSALLIAVLGVVGAWWPVDGDPGSALAILGYTTMPLWALWAGVLGIDLLRHPDGAPAPAEPRSADRVDA